MNRKPKKKKVFQLLLNGEDYDSFRQFCVHVENTAAEYISDGYDLVNISYPDKKTAVVVFKLKDVDNVTGPDPSSLEYLLRHQRRNTMNHR